MDGTPKVVDVAGWDVSAGPVSETGNAAALTYFFRGWGRHRLLPSFACLDPSGVLVCSCSCPSTSA